MSDARVCKRGHVVTGANNRAGRCLACYRIKQAQANRRRIKHRVIDPDVETAPVSELPDSPRIAPMYWRNLVSSVALLDPQQMRVVPFGDEAYHFEPPALLNAARALGVRIGYRWMRNTLYVWRVGKTQEAMTV
jgi:hypothetical protein